VKKRIAKWVISLIPSNNSGLTYVDEHKKMVLNWCTKADPYQKQHAAADLRHPNTVLWFFDSPEYIRWVEDANSAIWLFGIREIPNKQHYFLSLIHCYLAGAGKTILTSAVIEEAKILALQRSRHAVA
jgi:hypothetical protein